MKRSAPLPAGENKETWSRTLRAAPKVLDSDWSNFVLMPVKERKAGSLAVRYLLRGFDAIHLAAGSRSSSNASK